MSKINARGPARLRSDHAFHRRHYIVHGKAEMIEQLLARGGLKGLSRTMPLVAAPISAYLNNQHIQKVGDAAVRHYEGWSKAHEKATKASGE